MISLEQVADLIANRNFEKLRRVTIDTGGISMFLRMVVGQITNTGAVGSGIGFTPSKSGTGIYPITFKVPFPAAPVVQFGSDNGGALDIYWTGLTAAGFTAHVLSGGVHADAFFNFTATYIAAG